jgi:hypothetical protein
MTPNAIVIVRSTKAITPVARVAFHSGLAAVVALVSGGEVIIAIQHARWLARDQFRDYLESVNIGLLLTGTGLGTNFRRAGIRGRRRFR